MEAFYRHTGAAANREVTGQTDARIFCGSRHASFKKRICHSEAGRPKDLSAGESFRQHSG